MSRPFLGFFSVISAMNLVLACVNNKVHFFGSIARKNGKRVKGEGIVSETAEYLMSKKDVIILRITSYENSCPAGVLTSIQAQETIPFFGLIDMLLRMEKIMNQFDYPQRKEELRVFRPIHLKETEDIVLFRQPKALAVFQIQVVFRQHTSWQGRLIWMEQREEKRFRSVLELVELLHSALSD